MTAVYRARQRKAQTLVEYGILIALLTVVSLAILNVVGRNTSDIYVSTSDSLVTQTAERDGAASPPRGAGRGGRPGSGPLGYTY